MNTTINKNNPEPTGISKVLLLHPELNLAAVARRMGMKQSLLAAYVCGTKKPSASREEEIKETLRQIGRELIGIS